MRNQVLFIATEFQHLKTSRFLSSQLKQVNIDSCLYYPHSIDDSFDMNNDFKHVTNDRIAIPGILQQIGLVIFFNCASASPHLDNNKISFIAKKTGTSVVTLQHGWIQPGFNFITDIKKIGLIGKNMDVSRSLYNFSEIIPFEGEHGIGYPFIDNATSKFRFPNGICFNILITTNFNWEVYSLENIVAFLKILLALKQQFPSINIKHKPHPAENISAINSKIAQFYAEVLGIAIEQLPTVTFNNLNDALLWADVVISTPSTTVIDALMKKIPVLIFSQDVFKNVLTQFADITFDNSMRCCELMAQLVIDQRYSPPAIHSFKPAKFFDLVQDKINSCSEYKLDEEDFIKYIQLG